MKKNDNIRLVGDKIDKLIQIDYSIYLSLKDYYWNTLYCIKNNQSLINDWFVTSLEIFRIKKDFIKIVNSILELSEGEIISLFKNNWYNNQWTDANIELVKKLFLKNN